MENYKLTSLEKDFITNLLQQLKEIPLQLRGALSLIAQQQGLPMNSTFDPEQGIIIPPKETSVDAN